MYFFDQIIMATIYLTARFVQLLFEGGHYNVFEGSVYFFGKHCQ